MAATNGKPSTGGPLRAAARRLAGCAAGTISVEFALLAAFIFAPLIVVGTDVGRLGLAWSELTSAVRAGAQYGFRNQQVAVDSAGVIEAVRYDLDDMSANPTVLQYCMCPGSSTAIDCNDLCPDGGYSPMYIEVEHTLAVEMWFDYPGLTQPMPLTASAKMRVR